MPLPRPVKGGLRAITLFNSETKEWRVLKTLICCFFLQVPFEGEIKYSLYGNWTVQCMCTFKVLDFRFKCGPPLKLLGGGRQNKIFALRAYLIPPPNVYFCIRPCQINFVFMNTAVQKFQFFEFMGIAKLYAKMTCILMRISWKNSDLNFVFMQFVQKKHYQFWMNAQFRAKLVSY